MIEGYVHPAFTPVTLLVEKLFGRPGRGGASVAIYRHGELMVDVWAGHVDAAATIPWQQNQLATSFSTTKGITALLLHRAVERGEVEYDLPVDTYWPEFGANGKHTITIRDLLTHRAGMHDARRLVETAWQLLDHEAMAKRLAAAPPTVPPGTAPGYHGLTFGWLVGEVLRRVTGKEIAELFRDELAIPLGLDGMYLGCPQSERDRVARLFPPPPSGLEISNIARHVDRVRPLRSISESLLVPGFDEIIFDDSQLWLDAEMPAVNGTFTARSLAKVYGALANHGTIDGVQLLSPAALTTAGKVQTRQRDYVLKMPMRWRLGWHQAFITGRTPRQAFGHFGYAGSGAWADPETGLSVALTCNRLGNATTPIADARLARIGGAAMKSVLAMPRPDGHLHNRA